MKRLIALLLALAMTLSLAACGKKAPDAPQEDGSASGSAVSGGLDVEVPGVGEDFVIAFDQNDMPFSYLDENGELVGHSVDVAKAVCDLCGWNMKADPIDWADYETVLEEGTADCVWGHATEQEYYYDESDRMWMTYGEVFVDVCTLVTSDVETIPQLAGKTIEVDPDAAFVLENGGANEMAKLINEKAAQITTAKSAQAAYDDLFAEKCDAVIVNSVSDADVDFDQYTAESDEDGYVLRTLYSSTEDDGETLFFRSVGACFAQYNDYVDAVNEALFVLAEDGTIQSLMDAWDNTPWGSLTSRFFVYDYGEGDDAESEFDEDEDEFGELTEEELEELFGDMSVYELTDEDYEEEADAQP